jgi:hypothetical protein
MGFSGQNLQHLLPRHHPVRALVDTRPVGGDQRQLAVRESTAVMFAVLSHLIESRFRTLIGSQAKAAADWTTVASLWSGGHRDAE